MRCQFQRYQFQIGVYRALGFAAVLCAWCVVKFVFESVFFVLYLEATSGRW